MSELKRAARALVETRVDYVESRHGLLESRERLARALAKVDGAGASVFTHSWSEKDGHAILEARFGPQPRTQRVLQGLSLGMALAVAVSGWAIATQEGAVQFMLPLCTVLAIMALPFVALGLSSQREAAEARVKRAIRIALRDEPERVPAQQSWEDED